MWEDNLDEDRRFQCSSASRKFLNQNAERRRRAVNVSFQCSSASRKFLNRRIGQAGCAGFRPFSALQRAENSSIALDLSDNLKRAAFSALQRAENSSIRRPRYSFPSSPTFSALQRAENSSILADQPARRPADALSVLFSEPKIPQCLKEQRRCWRKSAFQCSSASRKFLNARRVWFAA